MKKLMGKFNIKRLYNKGTLIAFALLYAFLMTVGSTFSWVTSSNRNVNEFTGEMGLKAVIAEDFERQNQWRPGGSVTKMVSVCNDGVSPGFARVSFEEIVERMRAAGLPEPYEDPEEAGVAPEFCMAAEWDAWEDAAAVFDTVEFLEGAAPAPVPGGVAVKVSVSPAGLQRCRYAIYQVLDGGQAFRRMTAQFSARSGAGVTTLTVRNPRYWGYKGGYAAAEAAWGLVNKTGAAATPPLTADIENLICDTGKKIKIEYANVITALDGNAATDAGKWFYNEDDGFFYYIGKLEPGDSSAALTTGLKLDKTADASYSCMNLQFIVNLQALQLSAQALADDWGLSGQLLAHLSSFC
ncbi:MAG: hypothetical protein FWC27_06560 [Firmicutes bacterium]|nr:hypothetical protein [Bacillota bacterium]